MNQEFDIFGCYIDCNWPAHCHCYKPKVMPTQEEIDKITCEYIDLVSFLEKIILIEGSIFRL